MGVFYSANHQSAPGFAERCRTCFETDVADALVIQAVSCHFHLLSGELAFQLKGATRITHAITILLKFGDVDATAFMLKH